MEIKLRFFYDKWGLAVEAPQGYEAIRDILEDHRAVDSCERFKLELLEASEIYPISFALGFNSCSLTMNSYKQLIIKSSWFDSSVVIRLKIFFKLLDVWVNFIESKKWERYFVVEIEKLS